MIPLNKNDGKYRRQVGSIMTDREITCCLLVTRQIREKSVIHNVKRNKGQKKNKQHKKLLTKGGRVQILPGY